MSLLNHTRSLPSFPVNIQKTICQLPLVLLLGSRVLQRWRVWSTQKESGIITNGGCSCNSGGATSCSLCRQSDCTAFVDRPPVCLVQKTSTCNIVVANNVISPSLITSFTNGYDGSMLNGLQSLKQWESAFGYPSGGKLGLFNAIQVRTS